MGLLSTKVGRLPIAFQATGNEGQILTAVRASRLPAAAFAKGVENPLAGSALWACRGGSPAIAAGYAFQVFGARSTPSLSRYSTASWLLSNVASFSSCSFVSFVAPFSSSYPIGVQFLSQPQSWQTRRVMPAHPGMGNTLMA